MSPSSNSNHPDFLWWRDGVIYQIYPRSFQDSNGDGIGDLKGILNRLDYFSALGVDALWLSPIYPSPDKDFGYDVADYTAIDPRYGSMEDFDALVSAAHQRGIRIILDMVFNHSSDQHHWFQESKKSKDNPYRDYYIWRDPKPGNKPPNNWVSFFGGSGWEFDPATGQSYFHMFVKEQPDLNWQNPKVQDAILDVVRFWLDRGVDGFRHDVFNAYFKHPNLPDNPTKPGLRKFDQLEHVYDMNQPELKGWLKRLRSLVDSYPERYVVGETFVGTPESAASYCGSDLMYAAFDFNFLACPWKPERFLKSIQRWEQALPDDSTPNYVLNNHDNPRSATRYGRKENDERLKVAAALLLTQRGTPFLYYGEEIGMRDISLSRNEIQDPVGKYFWPFYKGRDGCRAPMQWDTSLNAGFSSARPWLPLHPDYRQRNTAAQQNDPRSLFNFYKKLITIRKEIPALRYGMTQPLNQEPRILLAYLRQTAEQTVLVALNFSRRKTRLFVGPEISRHNWDLLLSNRREQFKPVEPNIIRLDPEEALILIQRN